MSFRTQRLLLGIALLATAGMVVSAHAQLPNVRYMVDPNFTYPLVPTTTSVSGIPVVLPATLPGNSNTIYLSFAGRNNGSAATPVPLQGSCLVDGEDIFGWGMGIIAAGQVYHRFGEGPENIRGGRHVLGVIHDDPDMIVESNEDDNYWAHQFVFTPYVMSEATPVYRGAPPLDIGGIEHIVDGSLHGYNCDGFRFTSTGWWNAVILYADDNQHDYDLDLYPPSTGSENGFLTPAAGSYFYAGHLDGVIVNRNVVDIVEYDIGVQKYDSDEDSWFTLEQVVSQEAWVDDPFSFSLGTDEYLRIWDAYFGDPGWFTVFVDDLSGDAETVRVGLLSHDTSETSLSEELEWIITDNNGQARLNQYITTTGYYGLVIYRNPMHGGVAKTLNVRIESTPPDLLPAWDYTWDAPLVPSPGIVPPGNVPVLPDTLHGFVPETYVNFAMVNDSPALSPAVDVAIRQDGILFPYAPVTSPMLGPDTHWDFWGTTPIEYPGGRHTMSLILDHTDSIDEIYETNNVYGEQFCWSPLELSPGQQYSRSSPADAVGGVESVDPDVTFLLNCDGYRLANGGTDWEGMVLTQGPNSDYDLYVHHPLVGVKEGFDDFLVDSAFLEGETDYVLFNNNILAAGAHDVGVYNHLGDEEYVIEAVGSTSLPVPVDGRYGPYSMPVANMLHLYNVYLQPDLYAFRLDNLAGTVDWGLTLHPYNVSYQGRQDVMSTAFINGPGAGEGFSLNVPEAGWYGLAVFKTGPSEFDKGGTYQLNIRQGVTDVPDHPVLPKTTALAGVHPNPFNPQTMITFDLAVAATVELAIYDMKGARVRRLVHEQMPAGRHQAVWNGQDDSGQRVASGVYLARFQAGSHRGVEKVVMVK